jgi:hypothetical protein
MRSIVKISVLVFIATITSVIFAKQTSAQQTYVSFQVFYDQLSPYGQWVDYPDYGYVWIPDAGPGFFPYSTQGHWILTDYGWTWMSDYSWGWAPFHYGRWDYDQYYGWFWVPDNEWGPAWVSWRRAEGYYGWAPLEPGITLSVSFGRQYDSRHDHWIFVRDRDIDRSDINHYYINQTEKDQIVRRSSVINNTNVDNRRHATYVTGPATADFQKATGRQIKPVAIQDSPKPGQNISNDRFQIYRPEVIKNNDKGAKPVPARITNLRDVKQPAGRKVINQQENSNSKNNIKTEQQPNRSVPQKNSVNEKTLPQKSNSTQNLKTDKQPSSLKPTTTNPSQNIKKEQQPDNVKTLNTSPSQNIQRDQKPNNVKTLNATPSQNIQREQQPDKIKSQNTNPPENVKKELRPNNTKTMSTTPMQNTRRENQSKQVKSSDKSNNSNVPGDIKKKD